MLCLVKSRPLLVYSGPDTLPGFRLATYETTETEYLPDKMIVTTTDDTLVTNSYSSIRTEYELGTAIGILKGCQKPFNAFECTYEDVKKKINFYMLAVDDDGETITGIRTMSVEFFLYALSEDPS